VNIVLLHTRDAAEPPEDPVLAQMETALRGLGHTSRRLAVDDTVPPLVAGLTGPDPPDLVFNMAESFAGKSALESNVAALLNLLGLRYTGSSPAGLITAGDKSLTKKVLSFHGLRTPQFASVYRGAIDWAGDISFPLIVKPPQEDASLGITRKSVVHDIKELLEQMDEMQTEFQQPALVEQFIEGREFYVGVLGNMNPKALPVIELDFSKFPKDRPRIASWEAKWGDAGDGKGDEFAGTEAVFPSDVPEPLLAAMQKTAIEAFQALHLRDYARIDLRVTEAAEVYIIEVNPNCYLEKSAEFARAAARDGIEYEELIGRIVELAGGRYSR
jgi:D-alanine-D-alanine ligase